MQDFVPAQEGAHDPVDRQQAAALLAWWKLAGIDALVSDVPVCWLSPAAYMPPASPQPVTAGTAQSLAIAAPALTAPLPPMPAATLAELLADVRRAQPLAPIADGNPGAGIMIMGEAPSAEDLRTGRPFSGPAGVLLDQMLAAIGLDRGACYISLLTPRRRIAGTPPPEAVAADLELTRAHIRLAAPRLLLLLGSLPTRTLTDSPGAISALRGRWLVHDTGSNGIPAMPTFNPAYLLRRPEAKREAWADLLAFKRRIAP